MHTEGAFGGRRTRPVRPRCCICFAMTARASSLNNVRLTDGCASRQLRRGGWERLTNYLEYAKRGYLERLDPIEVSTNFFVRQFLLKKGAMKSALYASTNIGGHSLRSGFCAQGAMSDVPNWLVRETTGHTDDAMSNVYCRPVKRRRMSSPH